MNNTKKNFLWNVVGSTFNSFTSLFFMIIVTRIYGGTIAGIFTFAFSFASLMQVVGNYAGRSYHVTEIDNNIKDSDFLYSKIITCLFMILLSVIYILFRGYSFYKVQVMLLLIFFRMIEVIAEVFYGIIQKKLMLYQVGISLFVKGVLAVLIFLIINYFTHNLLLAIVGIALVNLIMLFFYDRKNAFCVGFRFEKIRMSVIKMIFIGGFFVFGFTFLTQYVINASKYAIDGVLSDKYQTIYGILAMPATLMLLCSSFIIQPFLVPLTDCLKKNKIKDFIFLVFKLCVAVLVFGIMAIGASYFLGIPVLEFIYGISLKSYRTSLLLVVLGGTLFGMAYIISTSLIAMRKNFIQLVIYLIVSVVSFFLSTWLVKTNGIFGASLSYCSTMGLLLIMYIIYFVFCVSRFNTRKLCLGKD